MHSSMAQADFIMPWVESGAYRHVFGVYGQCDGQPPCHGVKLAIYDILHIPHGQSSAI